MREQRFRRMEIWRKAMDFIEQIYKITNKFPKTEMYGLTNQIRRAALSIALNIAEGSGAGSDNEFNRFLNMGLLRNASKLSSSGLTGGSRNFYRRAFRLLDSRWSLPSNVPRLKIAGTSLIGGGNDSFGLFRNSPIVAVMRKKVS